MSQGPELGARFCPEKNEIISILERGSTEKGQWENAFSKIRNRFTSDLFLDDWKIGDVYEFHSIFCKEIRNEKILVTVKFGTPRLGLAELSGIYIDDNLEYFSLFLSEVVRATSGKV
jgi:hypothetical protein